MPSLNTTDLLVLSDFGAGVFTAGFSQVFDGGAIYRKSIMAVVVSAAARLISRSFPNATGGDMLNARQKNELVVGVLSMLGAYANNKNASMIRAFVSSISADLLAEWAFELMGMEDTVLISGGSRSISGVDVIGVPDGDTTPQQVPSIVQSGQKSYQTL